MSEGEQRDRARGLYCAANAPPRAYRVPRVASSAPALRLWRSNSPLSREIHSATHTRSDLRYKIITVDRDDAIVGNWW